MGMESLIENYGCSISPNRLWASRRQDSRSIGFLMKIYMLYALFLRCSAPIPRLLNSD